MMTGWLPIIALAGLLIGLFTWLRQELIAQVKELRQEINAQAREQVSCREEIIGRLSKLEGLLESLRAAITHPRAA